MSSYLDRLNSTISPILTGNTYIGSPSNVNKFQGVLITCITDQTGSLKLEWSNDQNNWDFSDSYNVYPNKSFSVVRQNLGTHFRVSFLNSSGTDQTFLRLHSRFVDDVPDSDVGLHQFYLWNNAAITAGDASPEIDMNNSSRLALYGNSSAAITFNVQVRNEITGFYNTTYSIIADGNFYIELNNLTAPLVRLIVDSGSATVSACGSSR